MYRCCLPTWHGQGSCCLIAFPSRLRKMLLQSNLPFQLLLKAGCCRGGTSGLDDLVVAAASSCMETCFVSLSLRNRWNEAIAGLDAQKAKWLNWLCTLLAPAQFLQPPTVECDSNNRFPQSGGSLCRPDLCASGSSQHV